MRVEKLIEVLQEMPKDARVYGYSALDEGDFGVDSVKVLTPEDEAPYCQGDSYIEERLRKDETVVVIWGS